MNAWLAAMFLMLAFITIARAEVAQGPLDIRDFGAVADGTTVNTAAIDKCSEIPAPGVIIAGGSYVTGTIYLKSYVTRRIPPFSPPSGPFKGDLKLPSPKAIS